MIVFLPSPRVVQLAISQYVRSRSHLADSRQLLQCLQPVFSLFMTTDSSSDCRQHLLRNGGPHVKRHSHLVTSVPLGILVTTWVLVNHSYVFEDMSFLHERDYTLLI